MKEAMHGDGSVVAPYTDDQNKRRRRRSTPYCSVCTSHIWLEPVYVTEPEDGPAPRLSWVLCKSCHQALQQEMERSPVRSPLRLRIAMGMIASERWPHAYSTRVREYINDRRWIVFMAAAFIIAMIIHLALIVMIASIR